MNLTPFASAQAAGVALAAEVAESLREGLAARGAGSLALPGGRTPMPLFHALRGYALDWSRVAVTLTDERWVPETDPASNGALLRRELLEERAAAARFVPLYQADAGSASQAAPVISTMVQQAMALPFDAVVLGMGEDGHFASLFPGNAGLAEALDPRAAPGCVAMQAPAEPRQRLSLNVAALMQTRRLFLLVTGEAKRAVLAQASDPASRGDWPIGALLDVRNPPLEVYWAP